MREFRLRTDLKRSVVAGYALPLGIEAVDFVPPTTGFTLAYTPGEEDEPDTYAFHVVVSHEKLRPLILKAFTLLPDEVTPIVEIGSRDAYRTVDVYFSDDGVSKSEYLRIWKRYEGVVLEDASIGVGANSEEPFVEIFVDSWKGLSIHVPIELREEVEAMLHAAGLDEVPETWPSEPESDPLPGTTMRDVLEIVDEQSPDIDELLLQLREHWGLELNVDPETNVDDAGRNLGLTLWHAVVVADAVSGDPERGAYLSIWASAGSLAEMERLMTDAIEEQSEWIFNSIYSVDRVAYDERPDELADLPPRSKQSKVHLVEVDAWGDPPATGRGKGASRG